MNRFLSMFCLLLSIFPIERVFANGDPVVYYSALALTCTPEPRRIPEIQLVSEDLVIEPGCPLSRVRVKYVLQNTSDIHFDCIHYGFPVDWFGDSLANIRDATFYTMAEQEFGWRDNYVKSVKFQIDDQELSWKCSKDTLLRLGLEKTIKKDEDWDQYMSDNNYKQEIGYCDMQKVANIYRKWYYTSFDFGPKQTRILTIEYRIAGRYTLTEEEAYSVFKESASSEGCSNYHWGYCELAYDFQPAAYWGNGKANEIRVMLSASEDMSVPQIAGLQMKEVEKRKWMFEGTDFDFCKAEPLLIDYYAFVKIHEDIEGIQKRRLPLSQYNIWANGKDIQNMKDNDLTTVGQILPNDEGKYEVYVQTDGNEVICGLLIYPGDCSSRSRYLQTSHWKSINLRYETNDDTTEFFFDCHKVKASSMSLRDLTDVAEKVSFAAYRGEVRKDFRPKWIVFQITDLEIKDNEPLYVSDIQLIGLGPKDYDKYVIEAIEDSVQVLQMPDVEISQMDSTSVLSLPNMDPEVDEPLQEESRLTWVCWSIAAVLLALGGFWLCRKRNQV